jgi:hypothetical protein
MVPARSGTFFGLPGNLLAAGLFDGRAREISR